MHSIVATSVLVLPLVTAAVIPKGTQIGLSYKWDRMSNGKLIQAFTSDGSLVASACADGLERDGFALEPVSFLVDPEHPWDGTISVGGVQHDFGYYEHNTTEHPRCALAYNEDFFEVSCQLHYGPGLDMPAIEPPSISECFLPELVPGLGYQNFHLTDTSRARPVAAWNESSDLVPRQSTSRRGTVRVGDGNPHQDPWHNQVTVCVAYFLYDNGESQLTKILTYRKRLSAAALLAPPRSPRAKHANLVLWPQLA